MATLPCLQDLEIKVHYGPDDHPRDTFYVPMLTSSVAYDRVGGYFSSALLASVADEAVRPFVANGGKMRMVVHAQLTEPETEAITAAMATRGDTDVEQVRQALLDNIGRTDLGHPTEGHALVGQLVAAGVLDIKVGVVLDDQGRPAKASHPRRAIFHAKEGMFTDTCGHSVVFEGSVNESIGGWVRNFEKLTTYLSWDHGVWDRYGEPLAEEFHEFWGGNAASRWVVVDLPDAKRQELIDYRSHFPGVTLDVDTDEAPAEDESPAEETRSLCQVLTEIIDQPWAGLLTGPVEPWPHQDATAREAIETVRKALADRSAPVRGRVFSDEVGLGKTIEVGLTLRQLLTEGTAERVLVAVPASVLDQWQEEMWEKIGLWVPQVDGPSSVRWPDNTHELNVDPWTEYDVLLASSHRVRLSRYRDRVLDAGWDVLVVDEAHHARRREKKKAGTANDLLRFLRAAKTHDDIGSILLATATPMQMDVHEARDLLDIVGLPEEWDDLSFRNYYDELSREDYADRNWHLIQRLVAASIDTFGPNHDIDAVVRSELGAAAAQRITGFADKVDPEAATRRLTSHERAALDAWLVGSAPLRHLVLRSTRDLLRDYQRSGLLADDVTIPVRDVHDVTVSMSPEERELYDDIETWVSDHYQAARAAKKNAAGFVMTVYRRRLTSSLEAIRISLQRRLDGLLNRRTLALHDLIDADDLHTGEEDAADAGIDTDQTDQENAELLELVGGIEGEIAHVRDFLARLNATLAANDNKDAKFDQLTALLDDKVTSGEHRTAIIFTQFSDTLNWLTRHLISKYGHGSVATFHGGTGALQDEDGTWRTVGKAEVIDAFRAAATDPSSRLLFLLGTDSMSEGLNLQTCDLLINYDLPWNFMRLEQRIGRIDRIGGPTTAYVRNLVIEGTVEERVRSGIDADHKDFQHVVGATGAVIEHTIKTAATTGTDPDIEAIKHAISEAQTRTFTLDAFNTGDLLGHEGDEAWTFNRGTILDDLAATFDAYDVITETGAVSSITDADGIVWPIAFDPQRTTDDPGVGLLVPGHPAWPCPTATTA